METHAPTAGLDLLNVERYLGAVLGEGTKVLGAVRLGDAPDQFVKGFGYGTPVRVDYQTANGERRSAVVHTMSPGPFGHEHASDRARILLWSHRTFNRLPRHVRSFDVGGIESSGNVIPLGHVEEFCLLTEYAGGKGYAADLEQMRATGDLTSLDLARADALGDYLVEIHKVRGADPALYIRRNRELVGDGECIMGLADSYPEHPLITPALLEQIEHHAVRWRWRLKPLTHRLRQVHGDFHPWNILFGPGAEFRLLDRSRGEYGDPADDVTSLTMNYLFFSLQRSQRLEGPFEILFRRFWDRYLEKSGDREMLQVAAPFLAFRGLVMASPLWYPNLTDTVRGRIVRFILAVLENETFDPSRVNSYCGA